MGRRQHVQNVDRHVGDHVYRPETSPLILGPRDTLYHKIHGTNFSRTLFNVVCTMAGSGILALPATVREGGWISLVILVLTGIMTNYTGHILVRCLHTDARGRLANYPAIGYAAFGNFGRVLVHIFHKATLLVRFFWFWFWFFVFVFVQGG